MERSKYTLEDFLTDDSFLDFVFDNTTATAVDWNRFLEKEHPELREVALQAKDILKFENENKCILTIEECKDLKNKILKDISKDEK